MARLIPLKRNFRGALACTIPFGPQRVRVSRRARKSTPSSAPQPRRLTRLDYLEQCAGGDRSPLRMSRKQVLLPGWCAKFHGSGNSSTILSENNEASSESRRRVAGSSGSTLRRRSDRPSDAKGIELPALLATLELLLCLSPRGELMTVPYTPPALYAFDL